MFQPPDHYHNLSLRLSEVLSDVGVNERMLITRRKMFMLMQTTGNIAFQANDEPILSYIFGSQTEGSTTIGLKSDLDILYVSLLATAIQDWPEWESSDKAQFFMIQNGRTTPGYCLLQLVRSDEPLSVQDIQIENCTVDYDGRVLLRNSGLVPLNDGEIRHGPAATQQGAPGGGYECDTVRTIPCKSWPKEALPWSQQQYFSGWPTAEIKRYAERQGCFLAPVASKTGIYPDLEWRISTSHAERCLMWNLNITQMRCYLLMKMMIKTFIEPKCKDVISSFMCKNVLFHCIADSPAAAWREHLTTKCLTQCLEALLNCVLTGNCPHFIIPGNNLLAGKLTVAVKQQLAVIICDLMQNIEQSLLRISIDNVGERLHMKSGGLPRRLLTSAYQVSRQMSTDLTIQLAASAQNLFRVLLIKETNTEPAIIYDLLIRNISKLLYIYTCGDTTEQLACLLYVPLLCTHVGAIMASEGIQHSRAVSQPALRWLSLGLKSDASSGKLKLASALYCSGDIIGTEVVLAAVKRHVEQTPTFSLCVCYPLPRKESTEEFGRVCYEKQEQTIKENIMFCVRFLPCEVHCFPVELRYEMFRFTQYDLPYREKDDYWMDWAVVDSLSFLYFLQYKVYSQLQRPADQQTALNNLKQTIDTKPNLGHRETALNLLGQCMEQENRWQDALQCYVFSLNVRPRKNAAKWHICRMLAVLLVSKLDKRG